MAAFRNVVFLFIGLMVITIIGFWSSYFSILFQPHPFSHHFHGIVMTLWVALLINQAWLVRTRRMDLHRVTGRASFVLAPLVVVSGLVVNFHFIAQFPDPTVPALQGIYWFGWFLPIAFAVLYVLAMKHRNDFQLHGRYMIATGIIFLFPGLGRALRLVFPDIGFFQVQVLVFGLCLALIAWDWRLGRIRAPFIVLSALWATNLVLWHLLPRIDWWVAFTKWSAGI